MEDQSIKAIVPTLIGKDGNRRILDILIPTYGRPGSAREAILSALHCKDHRFGIRCNSNRYEPTLEPYRGFDARLSYSYFESNQGASNNVLFLIENSCAKYCLLLSDEDRIDQDGLVALLNFLDSAPDNLRVVSCSVWCPVNAKFYHRPKKMLLNKQLDSRDFAIIDLVSTYMSGFIFLRDALESINYKKFLSRAIGNAYFHLDLSQRLLLNGKFRYFSPICILKGEDIKYGGDGYSHLASLKNNDSNLKDLNPDVYGPYARAMQFFYRMHVYRSMRERIGVCAYLLRSMSLFVQFSGAVQGSPKVVRMLPNTSPASEMLRATDDWVLQNNRLTWFEVFFSNLNSGGVAVRVSILRLMGFILSFIRKIYRYWIWSRR